MTYRECYERIIQYLKKNYSGLTQETPPLEHNTNLPYYQVNSSSDMKARFFKDDKLGINEFLCNIHKTYDAHKLAGESAILLRWMTQAIEKKLYISLRLFGQSY